MNKPKIGQIVNYQVRDDQKEWMQKNQSTQNVQSNLPAIIVAVWSETCVNLKVITDGKEDLWVTSALNGSAPGQWSVNVE
jgi:hypothetical protein